MRYKTYVRSAKILEMPNTFSDLWRKKNQDKMKANLFYVQYLTIYILSNVN